MDNFFHNILHENLCIYADKMVQATDIIIARSKAVKVPFLEFIQLFADKIEDMDYIREKFEGACPHVKEDLEEQLAQSNIKVSLCLSVLVNFLYPCIEQLEKVFEEGIVLEKDTKK